MQKLESKKRLYYITFLQVIGPIFVILGHSINGLPANDILLKIKEIIYVFHMPLFFFISGYLFLYKGGLSNISYKDFMKKKIWRLLFPYFVLNLIFILPKFLLSGFLDDKVNFSISYKIVKENNYVNYLIDRFDYKISDTKEKMEDTRKILNNYIDKKIKIYNYLS